MLLPDEKLVGQHFFDFLGDGGWEGNLNNRTFLGQDRPADDPRETREKYAKEPRRGNLNNRTILAFHYFKSKREKHEDIKKPCSGCALAENGKEVCGG